MEFERIAARCRRIVGTDKEEHAEKTGLEYMSPPEQSQVFIQAFREELQEDPKFSPLIWVARYMLKIPVALFAAKLVEEEHDTIEKNTRPAVLTSMENPFVDTERAWESAMLFLDGQNIQITPELMAEGFDHLEERSREFLDHYKSGKYDPEEYGNEMSIGERAANTRLLLDKGMPELRQRLKCWKVIHR